MTLKCITSACDGASTDVVYTIIYMYIDAYYYLSSGFYSDSYSNI